MGGQPGGPLVWGTVRPDRWSGADRGGPPRSRSSRLLNGCPAGLVSVTDTRSQQSVEQHPKRVRAAAICRQRITSTDGAGGAPSGGRRAATPPTLPEAAPPSSRGTTRPAGDNGATPDLRGTVGMTLHALLQPSAAYRRGIGPPLSALAGWPRVAQLTGRSGAGAAAPPPAAAAAAPQCSIAGRWDSRSRVRGAPPGCPSPCGPGSTGIPSGERSARFHRVAVSTASRVGEETGGGESGPRCSRPTAAAPGCRGGVGPPVRRRGPGRCQARPRRRR